MPYALYAQKAATSADAVKITGDQSISGNKTFSGIVKVGTPVNTTDAANKSYVDLLKVQIATLEDNLIAAGLYNLIDVEGNQYNVVKIGNQVWMKENSRTTKYNNDTDIPVTTDNTTWKNLTTPSYCWYSNDEASNKGYLRSII